MTPEASADPGGQRPQGGGLKSSCHLSPPPPQLVLQSCAGDGEMGGGVRNVENCVFGPCRASTAGFDSPFCVEHCSSSKSSSRSKAT